MREIKFRVWYEGTQFMDYSPNLVAGHFDDNEVNVNEEIADSGHPWMQYTGRKDKRDQEIWEGDIVRFDVGKLREEDEEIRHQKGAVLFDNDRCKYGDWISIYCGNVEVIGNIHENPDLLQT